MKTQVYATTGDDEARIEENPDPADLSLLLIIETALSRRDLNTRLAKAIHWNRHIIGKAALAHPHTAPLMGDLLAYSQNPGSSRDTRARDKAKSLFIRLLLLATPYGDPARWPPPRPRASPIAQPETAHTP